MKSTRISRRGLLQTAGTGALTMSLQNQSADIQRTKCAQKRPTRALTGISKWELDTPALCVDLDKMEQNIATMQADAAPVQARQPAAREDAQVRRDRQAAARGRRDRHLHRQAQRSRSAVRRTASTRS